MKIFKSSTLKKIYQLVHFLLILTSNLDEYICEYLLKIHNKYSKIYSSNIHPTLSHFILYLFFECISYYKN